MTSDRSTEEPCAAKVACTVLKTSGRGDPLAEFNRARRPAVIARQVSQCSKNTSGADAFAAFTSVIRTLMTAGIGSVIETLAQLFHPTQPQHVTP
jgi:hypothetical protein